MKISAKIDKSPSGIIIRPSTRKDHEALMAIPAGKELSITIGQPRRPDRNRAWWGAIDFFTHHCNENDAWQKKDREWIHAAVQIEIGHTEIIKLDDTTVYAIPKGTSYDKIPDEIEYTLRFFNPAMEYLAHRIGYASIEELMDAIRTNETE